MAAKPLQSSLDRRTVIPQHIQEAMAQHMQQSMPANLKKYAQGSGYIPQQTQEAMAQHMQRSVPSHMKQYVGAYMQQKVVAPRMTVTRAMSQSPIQSVPVAKPGSTVHPIETQQFQPSFAATGQEPTPQDSQQRASNETPPPGPSEPILPNMPPQPYDFIVNPDSPKKQRSLPSLPGLGPTAMRAVYAAGGLLVLLIGFVFVKGLVAGSSNITSLVGITQDQQELVHLVSNASLHPGLSTTNQNFAATAQLSLASSQSTIFKYMVANGQKINVKTINAKVSTAIDTQLTNSGTSNTYDQTFHDIMKVELNRYATDLNQSYQLLKGANGRALLKDDYGQSQLLLKQLDTPAS